MGGSDDGARESTGDKALSWNNVQAQEKAVLDRIDYHIRRYHSMATGSGTFFKVFKLLTLVSAALVPLLAANADRVFVAVDATAVTGAALAAGLGALIVVIEGVQQLYQWQQNWVGYRATALALSTERALYRARAGDYERTPAPHRLLASRTEEIMSREHQSWTSSRTQQLSKEEPLQ
jgi:hypothetical protein